MGFIAVFMIAAIILSCVFPNHFMAIEISIGVFVVLVGIVTTMKVLDARRRTKAMEAQREVNDKRRAWINQELAKAQAQLRAQSSTDRLEERLLRERGPRTEPVHNPELFETQMAEMFRRYGYKVIQTSYQGDHGIDLKIIKPNEYAIVQCKRYSPTNKVGEPSIREFFGVMEHEGVDVGYFITTGDYTDNAYRWAKGKRMVLINGERLQKMLEETEHLFGGVARS